jgi:peptidylprolyl isomerase
MKIIVLLIIINALIATSCAKRNDLEPEIKFKTTAGNITVRLYAETPKHRDNFLKLVEAGYYDGVLFHRVIADFMIQAGDPESKNAKRNQELGSGDVKFTIPAEIVYPKYYHKKGALAAARQGEDMNPERASSGAQFYFVKGHLYTDVELNKLEQKKIDILETKLFDQKAQSFQNRIQKYEAENNQEQLELLKDSILYVVKSEIEKKPTYKFTDQQRNDYKTIGGTPHLDGAYTVFGEVIDGIEIVSNISIAKTGKMDRPLEDIRILKATRVR